ncbi:hypothetical protein GCM10008986_16960 [Salinibacillus aidingensis]|uniref:Uncharacterized protein n=1 Tax=Salinibacillus aidingensis TaxID=237684 RepID=A0ABN1B6Z5_9BACI
MNRVGELRKIRSDKKQDIKPHIPFSLYDLIDRLSYITRKPIKDIGELLCIKGLDSSFVLDSLSLYFTRDYSSQGTIYIAQSDDSSRRIKIKAKKRRISLRFNPHDHNRLINLSHALGLTVASTTSLLLIYAATDIHIIQNIVQSEGHLGNNRVKEARYVLKKAKKGVWKYEATR